MRKIHEIITPLKLALEVDARAKEEMTKVVRTMKDGEFLLNDPGRSFVREGNLIKKSNRSGRCVEYRFFLFSDVLIYAKASASHVAKRQDGSTFAPYKIHEELPLHMIKVVDWFPPEQTRSKKAFQIHHPRKTILVYAESPEEKHAWVKTIRETIGQEMERKASIESARLAALSAMPKDL